MKEPKDCPGKFGSGPETEIAIQRKSYRRILCIGLIATTKGSSRSEMMSMIFFFPSSIKFLGVIIKPTALGMLPKATFHLHNYILKPIVFFKAIKTAESPDPSNSN